MVIVLGIVFAVSLFLCGYSLGRMHWISRCRREIGKIEKAWSDVKCYHNWH